MDTRTVPYSFECFRDVAVRRAAEAEHLLSLRKKHCDGAVTCALLATECALKATLLFGNEVKYHHELPEDILTLAFKGSTGHDLGQLLHLQPPGIMRDTRPPLAEVRRLHRQHRYEHRYGHKRPLLKDARIVVDDAKTVIQWMQEVVT